MSKELKFWDEKAMTNHVRVYLSLSPESSNDYFGQHLYEPFKKVIGVAHGKLGFGEVEEITQKVLLRLLRELPNFDAGKSKLITRIWTHTRYETLKAGEFAMKSKPLFPVQEWNERKEPHIESTPSDYETKRTAFLNFWTPNRIAEAFTGDKELAVAKRVISLISSRRGMSQLQLSREIGRASCRERV